MSARPLPGEGLDAFVQRLTEDPRTKKEIVRANEGLRRLRSDKAVNVPYILLSQSFRKIAIEALYPEDRATLVGWEHRVTALPGKPESLWRIAEWFTGDGRNYRQLRETKCQSDRLPRDAGRARSSSFPRRF